MKQKVFTLIELLVVIPTIALFLTSCYAPASPDSTLAAEPFSFIVMADPQLGQYAHNENFTLESELFQRAITEANRLDPEFVVIAGDLVNQPGNDAQAREVLRIAGQLDKKTPLYLVAGNHDTEYIITEESRSWYCQKFGRDWYSFDKGNWHFIVLNSALIEHPENLFEQAKSQKQWLIDDLEESSKAGKNSVVFMHYPLLPADYPLANNFFRLSPDKRDYYLKLFSENRVLTMFAGHLHYNLYSQYGDMEIIAVSAVAAGILHGDDPHGFMIVKVFPDKLEHKYYPLKRWQ